MNHPIGIRRRPTLPGRVQPSTIGAEGLNFCVRYGNRWDPFAIATGNCIKFSHSLCFRLPMLAPIRFLAVSAPQTIGFAPWGMRSACFAFTPLAHSVLPKAPSSSSGSLPLPWSLRSCPPGCSPFRLHPRGCIRLNACYARSPASPSGSGLLPAPAVTP